jgi:hypothetical protein
MAESILLTTRVISNKYMYDFAITFTEIFGGAEYECSIIIQKLTLMNLIWRIIQDVPKKVLTFYLMIYQMNGSEFWKYDTKGLFGT